MLRSTGFFRGIDCPFYADYGDGKGKNGCNRPYCHFRHSQHRLLSYGADTRRGEISTAQKEQGYDPFNPEVVHPPGPQNDDPAPSGDISGALALVNRAIEEVRSQMEKEKRKLSRIGDEPYDPRDNSALESSKVKASTSHLTYDPENYKVTSVEYNPSPGSSKYTLDTNAQENSANSMEYVPTLPKKPTNRSQQLPTAPPSAKYSNSPCKYTLDNTKPSTDMEYDPLSNYSASIAGKNKKEETATKTDGSSYKIPNPVEEYVVSVKKPPPAPIDSTKYTFSESDGESSGTEYKPTSISSLPLKKNNSGTDSCTDGKKAIAERVENAVTQTYKREENGLKRDQVKHKSTPEKKKLDHGNAEKRTVNESSKSKSTSNSKSSSSSKDRALKSSHHDSSKKENKSHGRKEERSKDNVKMKKEIFNEERKTEGKGKSGDKLKTSSSRKREREADNVESPSKKVKLYDKEKSRHHKNGQLESSKSPKDVRKDGKSSSGHSKTSVNIKKTSSKDKLKHSSSPRSLKKPEKKERSLSLSHADLFGDESPEEADPIELDDEYQEETLVRKCADAVKRRLNKRKVSELTPSSSDDEPDCVMVSSTAAKEEVESMGIDLSALQDLDFESDPLEECLRIFNESSDVKKEDKGRQAKQASVDSDEEKGTESTLTTLFPGQKKRVSHFVAKGNVDTPPKAVVRPYKRPTAQEVCYQRMQLAQQQAVQLSVAVNAASHSPSFSGEKKRIAHRPSPQLASTRISAVNAKPNKSRVLSPSQAQPSVRSQTTAGILSKTTSTVSQKRVAHTPTLKSTSMKRPIIPAAFGSKVPTNVRQRCLNAFIDECVKFCSSEASAFQMALDEEKLVYERSSCKTIYTNVAANTLTKIRSKSKPSPSPVSNRPPGSVGNRRAQSHKEVLGGRLAATTSFTVNRMGKQSEEKLSGATLYHRLKTYLMTEEQLQEHGYPRKNPEAPGKAIVHNPDKKPPPSDPFTKVCCRCSKEYQVSATGSCVRREECCHHWGRVRRYRGIGGLETNYSCCNGAVGSPGCEVAKQHVQDGRKESQDGFVSTFSKHLPPDGNGGVFALDCEMCYTKQGLELTRVTVIDSKLKVIYDTFVKPASKVVDYNTRFSGVTEEDLENATITLRDVQAVLLSMFSADSILLGHSLESDFLALKLIHSSVVDTAIVFPHRLGLPFKRALRNLMGDHLKRIIQNEVGGHDSSEDASACMELMIWKIKEDAKVKR